MASPPEGIDPGRHGRAASRRRPVRRLSTILIGAMNPARLLDRCDAVLFDLDGTLVDTLGDFADAIARMLAERGKPPLADAAVAPLVGRGGAWLVEQALKLAEGTAPADDALEAAVGRFRHHYAALNGRRVRVYAGVTEGLSACAARGLRLGCVTNKPTAAAADLLAQLGLAHRFALIQGGDRHGLKPDPAPLLQAAHELGVDPARVVMVGDSVNDAQAARAAGMGLVIVTYGYNHGQPARSIEADAHLDSLAELGRR